MSAEATGWVFRHSPYTGATFAVHLAIADSVNDQHGNELWMRQSQLAVKARVERGTVSRSLDRLVADGLLTVLEDNSRAGKANRYRFEFPADLAVVHESRGGARTDDTQGCARGAQGCDESAHPGAREARRGGARTARTEPKELEPKEEPKGEPNNASVVSDDLGDASRLATLLADCIEERGNKRPTVTRRWTTDMDRLLRLDGREPDDVERVIRWLHRAGDDVAAFWQPNVRSPAKLRAKWDQMREQYTRRYGTGTRTAAKTLIERYEEEERREAV